MPQPRRTEEQLQRRRELDKLAARKRRETQAQQRQEEQIRAVADSASIQILEVEQRPGGLSEPQNRPDPASIEEAPSDEIRGRIQIGPSPEHRNSSSPCASENNLLTIGARQQRYSLRVRKSAASTSTIRSPSMESSRCGNIETSASPTTHAPPEPSDCQRTTSMNPGLSNKIEADIAQELEKLAIFDGEHVAPSVPANRFPVRETVIEADQGSLFIDDDFQVKDALFISDNYPDNEETVERGIQDAGVSNSDFQEWNLPGRCQRAETPQMVQLKQESNSDTGENAINSLEPYDEQYYGGHQQEEHVQQDALRMSSDTCSVDDGEVSGSASELDAETATADELPAAAGFIERQAQVYKKILSEGFSPECLCTLGPNTPSACSFANLVTRPSSYTYRIGRGRARDRTLFHKRNVSLAEVSNR